MHVILYWFMLHSSLGKPSLAKSAGFFNIVQKEYLQQDFWTWSLKNVFFTAGLRFSCKIHVMNLALRCVPLRGCPWGGEDMTRGGRGHFSLLDAGGRCCSNTNKHGQTMKYLSPSLLITLLWWPWLCTDCRPIHLKIFNWNLSLSRLPWWDRSLAWWNRISGSI